MIKDEMKKLWEGLSGGLDGIYQKYSQVGKARDQQYQNQLDQAKKDYHAQQNAASAQAKIRSQNAQNALSAHGLGNSGESLQAQLMNGLAQNNAMNEAAERYGQTVLGLQTEKLNADAESEGKMLSEMTGLSKDLYALKAEEAEREREAEALDRELALKEQQQKAELALKEKQAASENSLEQQKLKLEQDRLAEESRQFDKEYDEEMKKVIEEYQEAIVELENSVSRYEGREAMKEDQGAVPDIDPLEMYQKILTESRAGLSWWDESDEQLDKDYRARVVENVKKVIDDPEIDEEFRKSVEIYAVVGGYL